MILRPAFTPRSTRWSQLLKRAPNFSAAATTRPEISAICSSVKLFSCGCSVTSNASDKPSERRFLYVAEPGIRNYLEYGGQGVLVFDIDNGHRFVKRIPVAGLDEKDRPLNVKGVCANASTRRLYVSTTSKTLVCLDLLTDKVIWEKVYDTGCDRMAVTPDGSRTGGLQLAGTGHREHPIDAIWR